MFFLEKKEMEIKSKMINKRVKMVHINTIRKLKPRLRRDDRCTARVCECVCVRIEQIDRFRVDNGAERGDSIMQ